MPETKPKANNFIAIAIQILGLLIFVIGLSSLAGYSTGTEHFYRWYGKTAMAFNTATAFLIEGMAFILVGKELKK